MNNNQIIKSLHQNASDFFTKVSDKNFEHMNCKKGCSACCKVDLSVFEIEADLIRTWFNERSVEERKNIIESWQLPSKDGFCQFLKNDSCTIYESRPTICRTQGLPLFLEAENLVDYCPLNFENEAPQRSDWLNLDRLNMMLSIAAKSQQKDQRIRLTDLQKELIDSI